MLSSLSPSLGGMHKSHKTPSHAFLPASSSLVTYNSAFSLSSLGASHPSPQEGGGLEKLEKELKSLPLWEEEPHLPHTMHASTSQGRMEECLLPTLGRDNGNASLLTLHGRVGDRGGRRQEGGTAARQKQAWPAFPSISERLPGGLDCAAWLPFLLGGWALRQSASNRQLLPEPEPDTLSSSSALVLASLCRRKRSCKPKCSYASLSLLKPLFSYLPYQYERREEETERGRRNFGRVGPQA